MTNETFWGPAQTVDESSAEISFYGGFKSEKLGKIADWIGLENKARYRNHDSTERDDSFFSVVDSRSGNPTKKSYRPQTKVLLCRLMASCFSYFSLKPFLAF